MSANLEIKWYMLLRNKTQRCVFHKRAQSGENLERGDDIIQNNDEWRALFYPAHEGLNNPIHMFSLRRFLV
jgi:hypothetical protein